MATKLKWGILGTGSIAKAFAKALAGSKTGTLAAVGSRSQASADTFGDQFDVPRRHASYDALLADPNVDAVYISTPHPMHAEWAIKTAEAGKHVLCEKPIGVNHAQAMAIIEAAHRHDVFLAEAFMYRCHPQTAKLVQLLRDRVIGDVRVIQATFSFHTGFNPNSRLLANDMAGGGILDVGSYCTSMARLVAGVATGGDVAEPISVTGAGYLGQTGVDEYAVATLKFPGDIVATLATGVSVSQENVVRIFGTEGRITIPSPWIPARDGGAERIIVERNGQPKPQRITVQCSQPLYAVEADMVARNIKNRQPVFPAMNWDDTLGNMKTLDAWRAAIGLTYDMEKPGRVGPAHGGKLKVRDGHNMKYAKIPGLDKSVSRLVMGVDNQTTMPHAAAIFDEFFERGGNCFDTAHIYGGGIPETLLGQWVRDRGVREKVVILDKGAHTPNCTPEGMDKQFRESLGRLGLDYVDIYMFHRDNPEVPVGEFVDLVNQHIAAGRIRTFGGSNWTRDRVDAANAYAKSKGLTGMVAVSNNLSLAEMVNPPWDGCIGAYGPEWRNWLCQTGMILMPWSSQARGFFTDRSDPNDRSDAELVRCWYSDANFQRKAQALELAAKHNVHPISIALAYILNQPFQTFPLIGPRAISEMRASFDALDIALTPDELASLNLEA